MFQEPDDLHLLMAHAGTGDPVLPDGLPDASLTGDVETVEGEEAEAGYLWNEGGDPQDLGEQRWGIIVPNTARAERLLELMQPLIARRAAQQGDEVKVYRIDPNMSADQAVKWKRDHFNPQSDFGLEVPRYQLILGDLDEVPLCLQAALGTDGFVGRLAMDRDDDYRAYAEKVLRWEDKPSERETADSLYYTVHDQTGATRAGYRALMQPGLELAKKYQAKGRYQADELLDLGDRVVPSPDEFLELARRDRLAALFSVSHGEGPPRGGWANGEAQRLGQGAMSFGREGHIRAEDIPDGDFVKGGIWFMLACYGAGTPGVSAYKHWLENLRGVGQFRGRVEAVLEGIPKEGDRPFIAAVPKKVLANPDGPLAFIGHIDLAWTYSFQELDQGVQSRAGRFLGVLRMLLDGDRVGVATRDLLRGVNDLNNQLATAHDGMAMLGTGGTPAWLGHVWMARNDLSAWILLGDPAVRMPFARFAETSAPSGGGLGGMFGFAPEPAATRAPLALDAVESAVFALLSGRGDAATLASAMGIDAARLTSLAHAYRDAGRGAIRTKL